MKLNIKNHFISELPADAILENSRRQVFDAAFSYIQPKKPSHPKIIHIATDFAKELGFSQTDLQSQEFADVFTGSKTYPNTKPFAMCYAGHQFGHWAGQLGDGRAINLFEIEYQQKNWMFQLKGAGETPYSRNADGLAVLRSSIREYLCSEAMYHLGVPTTRALTLALSGDEVLRDMLYDGNPAFEKGAIVTRVAPSFLRFGSYEIFTARNDIKNLKILVDFTINHHFKYLGITNKKTYALFFEEVCKKTLAMIIHWQRVGFVHGVMNTDNMSILGLTIDYGPYGWLEDFDFGWTPNTTDRQHKRYRYGNQPNIALWNLYQLANALYPLLEDAKPFEKALENFKIEYEKQSLQMMLSKIGLFTKEPNDEKLIEKLFSNLESSATDLTIFFRNLSNFKVASNGFEVVKEAFYNLQEIKDAKTKNWEDWFVAYEKRLQIENISFAEKKQKMNAINPKYVLRNYMAQLAIDAAENKDYNLIDELYQLLKKPYDEQPENEKWFAKRPDWAKHKIGCSMLSCSS